MRIDNQVTLITGGSEGIGAACAESFRARGAKLVLMARSREALERVAGKDALAVVGDVTLEEDRRHAVDAAIDRFGRIDILINNAGAGLYAPTWEAPLDKARAMFELNVIAALGMVQLVVPGMRTRGAGTVVNVASIAGKVTLPWLTLYSASKHALVSMTDGLRMELRRDGIHCMSVCPGYVPTRFLQHLMAGRVPQSLSSIPRFSITAERCAEAIARGVESGAATVVAPRAGWVFIALSRLLPARVEGILERMHLRGMQS
ncbi:MAG: SDR family NAD(P)-dependent oxidoreductase [Candidatus Solibacter usitatus]|nr:SDR family NAD(P)-dependent oxidoreductase [Candidatus Solibacter usitatus]